MLEKSTQKKGEPCGFTCEDYYRELFGVCACFGANDRQGRALKLHAGNREFILPCKMPAVDHSPFNGRFIV